MFNLGARALKRLVVEGDGYAYFRSNLKPPLFKGEEEQALFAAVDEHFRKYKVLPQLETIVKSFPDLAEVEATEPAQFYVDLLDNRFAYDMINRANIESQDILKNNKADVNKAIEVLDKARGAIMTQRYRSSILDFAKDGGALVTGTYYGTLASTAKAGEFGWEYLDAGGSGSILPGDMTSIVGRPAMGKTWFLLYIALHNWRAKKLNVLFVSMEMNTLALAQRSAAMYAGTNIGQLKAGLAHGYATANQKKFDDAMYHLQFEDSKFYIIDGNLAANPEEVYVLADQLECDLICIDGAYLMRSKNPKLGRFDRVADNVELMKRYTTETEKGTVASWQFNRVASQKEAKKGQKATLDDIGYSDAIGQISTVVLGLMQEEGVSTLETRSVDVLKGRNGEIGKFEVNWLFGSMDFSQVGSKKQAVEKQLLHLE